MGFINTQLSSERKKKQAMAEHLQRPVAQDPRAMSSSKEDQLEGRLGRCLNEIHVARTHWKLASEGGTSMCVYKLLGGKRGTSEKPGGMQSVWVNT